MGAEVTAAAGTACWCCGEERSEADLARLQCHHDVALCAICLQWLGERVGSVRNVNPILGTVDLARTLAHYEALGFETGAHGGGGYGFAARDRVELHFRELPGLDPATNRSSCYLQVADVDAIHAESAAAGWQGTSRRPRTRPTA